MNQPMEDFVTRGGLSELIGSAQAASEDLRRLGAGEHVTTQRLEAAINGAVGACEEAAEAEHLRPRTLQVTALVGDLISVVASFMATPIPGNNGARFVDARVTCHCGGAVNLHGGIGPTEPLPVTWSRKPCDTCERVYTFAWGSR